MSGSPDAPLLRHALAELHGRYFVSPARAGPARFWLVGFHGQGQTGAEFMSSLDLVPRSGAWLLASVQGLNRHYARRGQAIVATWMTSEDRDLAIQDNVRWVDRVLDRLEEEFGSPDGIVFAGFSQGVAMAYRAALLGRRTCAAVIACCGDVPPEFGRSAPRPWPMVLVATGSDDAWYTRARLDIDAAAIARQGADVRTLVFDGGHAWTGALAEGAGRLLGEVERARS